MILEQCTPIFPTMCVISPTLSALPHTSGGHLVGLITSLPNKVGQPILCQVG